MCSSVPFRKTLILEFTPKWIGSKRSWTLLIVGLGGKRCLCCWLYMGALVADVDLFPPFVVTCAVGFH